MQRRASARPRSADRLRRRILVHLRALGTAVGRACPAPAAGRHRDARPRGGHGLTGIAVRDRGPVTLTGAVQGHLATVTQLLDGHPPAQLQTQLYSQAGEVAGLAGWLAADMGQHDRALIYFDNGIKAAQEAKDQALGAYLLGSVTTLPAFRNTAPKPRSMWLREETRGFRARDATPTTGAWLASSTPRRAPCSGTPTAPSMPWNAAKPPSRRPRTPSACADRLLLRPRTAGRRARSVLRAPAPLR